MPRRGSNRLSLDSDPLWYKDAIIYELHPRAFCDSNGDGIGDFRGLTERLGYLQDLGVSALWLLPFYPSPLKDDGYDIADYKAVHPDYGVMSDFRLFLQEAHRRGLRVITELVLNHTSDQHPWFQRARRAPPGSRWRDFYVWSDNPERYKSARVIFQDFEPSNWAWDPVAKAYYWHRFYSHQPDLNYDNPLVWRAMQRAVDFWLGMGVDGLRLDAVPYLFEREGTSCENLPETHAFLKFLRKHVDEKFNGRMLLAEANQWPEDAISYFGNGEECHMAFHFPLMPRLFMAMRTEDRFPIIDILLQTPDIPESSQWALFLRNHDELTLEMVTDEERDYMYRIYAQDSQARINLGIRRRLAPLVGNHRRRLELMKALLFSLPGTPALYYGDEIGMGDNIYLGDRNSVRTPMQWSADRNAGFSRANPQRLYLPVIIDPEYHYESINVEAEQSNTHSLLWWMKRLIALRKRYRAFSRGSIEFLYPENRKILAFLRCYQDETILVVANLSRFAQYVELGLSAFKGAAPVELFGQTRFPPIGDLPYLLTIGPHAFYWFALEHTAVESGVVGAPPVQADAPVLVMTGRPWPSVLQDGLKPGLERIFPSYFQKCRWFRGKARIIRSARLVETIPMASEALGSLAYLSLVRVEYTSGEPETYVLPLAITAGQHAEEILRDHPQAAVARLEDRDKEEWALLYDAMWDGNVARLLLEAITKRRVFTGETGKLVAGRTRLFPRASSVDVASLEISMQKAEQSNTSVVYGDHYILKVFRQLGAGLNPDLEIGRYLTEKARFVHAPPVLGSLELRHNQDEPLTIAILQEFVPNEGDAWQYTLDALSSYFERVLAHPDRDEAVALPAKSLLTLAHETVPGLAYELIGPYLRSAELLGKRTAEMHLALAANWEPAFAPEPFTTIHQHSLYQSLRGLTSQNLQLLRTRLTKMEPDVREQASRILALESEIYRRCHSVVERPIMAMRTRCHGDYHLGQVLYTGKDFVIIDFEGEPARSLSERRIKRSPLSDVAGMIRSFHYASYAAMQGGESIAPILSEPTALLEPWAHFWYVWVSSVFLKSYLELVNESSILPHDPAHLGLLMDTYLLEKAVYELGYELNNRPQWVKIPMTGILHLLEVGP